MTGGSGFGLAVRAHRRRLGLSQEDLAERIGVSISTIGKVEAGRISQPRPATVRLLADAFGLTGDARDSFCQGADEVAPAARPATQLPPDVHSFTGRADELARLDALLAGSGTRPAVAVISALSGMAGIGKTSLAVHWAHRVAAQFPDGQLYVNLRGFDPSGRVMDPADAIRGFLDALGVAPGQIPASPDAQAARYRSLLAGRRVLVVLDNARDAEQVRALLPGSPTALVLVTSRNQLTGLLATDGAHPLNLGALSPRESRDLLNDRLGIERVDAEPGAVPEIVAACAGLPLALSIAAARAQQSGFPLAALVADLTEAGRLNALDTGDPLSDVRTIFSWSYATLTPPAARLFRLLGRHPGADLSTVAAAALAGAPVAATRRLLAELTRASLVTEHRPGRFSQHDLLRAYAAELVSPEEAGEALSRLIAHYVHTACTANRLVYPNLDAIAVPLEPRPDGVEAAPIAGHDAAMAWLTTEHANLLAAAAHAAGAGLHTYAWQLAWGLDTFHYRQWHLHDQVATWQAAVTAARHLDRPGVLAYTHRRLGEAYRRLGRPAEGSAQAREALALFDGIGDQCGVADVHLDLSMHAEREGNLEEALQHAERALAATRSAGAATESVELRTARALNTVGWFHALLGDQDAALTFCREALAINTRWGDEENIAFTLDSLGYAHQHRHDYEQAVDHYERAIDAFRRLGYASMTADALERLGDTHHEAGKRDAARTAWTESLDIRTRLELESAESVRVKLRTRS
ncbi:tetratricopeptide repeat protein [Actinoplanes sp. Pm04-4]|uniref:Tetratricopeptide repeat protein n=1 Tax=Paractinoplanes pyxinae TaxID=2997416 RepID=A0ABT4AUZ6_9ACTN|nr:tetratricopeptide repeat protein [Actinoplanes pyxinae]MCY1138022.1 tetratricopeptide repeat protein [Actinoplanes pyxinae]